jgi:hypothetical protein
MGCVNFRSLCLYIGQLFRESENEAINTDCINGLLWTALIADRQTRQHNKQNEIDTARCELTKQKVTRTGDMACVVWVDCLAHTT